MKNAIHFVYATLFLLSCSSPALLAASPDADTGRLLIKVAPVEGKKIFELWVANLQKQPIKVKVKDVWGYQLLSIEVQNEHSYYKAINLKNLPDGDYLLQIEHPSSLVDHAFHLEGSIVSFFQRMGKNEGFTVFAKQKDDVPRSQIQFYIEKDQVKMWQEGKESAANIHVCNIRGKKHKVYYRKKVKMGEAIDEQFATEKLTRGEYMIVVQTGRRTIIQFFDKTEKDLHLKNAFVSRPLLIDGKEIYSQR